MVFKIEYSCIYGSNMPKRPADASAWLDVRLPN